MSDTIDDRWIEHQIGYLLRRASAAMAADYTAQPCSEPPLRPVQVSMLSVISANPGIAPGALGATLGIQRTNIAPLVGRLVAIGLVVRRPSPADGRRFELYLTTDGERAWVRGRDRIEQHEARMTERLSETERAQLRVLLHRIISQQ